MTSPHSQVPGPHKNRRTVAAAVVVVVVVFAVGVAGGVVIWKNLAGREVSEPVSPVVPTRNDAYVEANQAGRPGPSQPGQPTVDLEMNGAFTVLWSTSTDGENMAVAANQVIVSGGGEEVPTMHGYDRATGERLWSVNGPELAGARCWDTDSTALMACASAADGGRLWLMNPATGAVELEKLGPAEAAEDWGLLRLLEVDGGYLLDYLSRGSVGEEEGRRLAFAQADGSVRWDAMLPQEGIGVDPTTPWYAVDGIVIGDRGWAAFDLATGANLVEGIEDCPGVQVFPGRHLWCHSTAYDRPPQVVQHGDAEPATVHFATALARFAWIEHPGNLLLASDAAPFTTTGYGPIDPVTETPIGSWTIEFEQVEWAVWNGGEMIAALAGQGISFVDLATGEVVSKADYADSASSRAVGSDCRFLDDSRLLVLYDSFPKARGAALIDARTGESLGSFEALAVKAPHGPRAAEPYIIAATEGTVPVRSARMLHYLVPTPALTQTPDNPRQGE
ncbi:MAG: PQQ-like beta-propeller repeat protein [Bifidobacteriaceae bacterium]|jgi:hypothetical protein|nr:PQQ-like beta-propeller repeat protein [Bifidobacteriaceae bacterium]